MKEPGGRLDGVHRIVFHFLTTSVDWGIKSMTSTSQKESERLLRGYLGHIDSWDTDGGDTFLMLNAREWLEEHLDSLTPLQRRALAAGDRSARQLLLGVTGQTMDVEYLRETVKVIAGSALSEFAQAA